MKKVLPTVALVAILGALYLGYRVKIRSSGEPKWTTDEYPLTVYHDGDFASADGFWQSTSSSNDMQLMAPSASKITCDRSEKICREADAGVFIGILQAGTVEYDISSWNDEGIVADNGDTEKCGIVSRLSLDFKKNSVTVIDYPKISNDKDCHPLAYANSFALRGGNWVLHPAPGGAPSASH